MPRSSEPARAAAQAAPAVPAVPGRVVEVGTPLGPARAHVHEPAGRRRRPLGVLVLGHGAGGGVEAVDLQVAAAVATSLGWRAVLVEQPWRVAGGKVAPAPARLDTGWLAVAEALAAQQVAGPGTSTGRLVVGGRSAGARVACRTATTTGADAVLCLAFPLHPPGRPERSRAAELAGAGVPVTVVQGRRDPFGGPDEVRSLALPAVAVVAVDGDHGLKASAQPDGAVAAAVRDLLAGPAPE